MDYPRLKDPSERLQLPLKEIPLQGTRFKGILEEANVDETTFILGIAPGDITGMALLRMDPENYDYIGADWGYLVADIGTALGIQGSCRGIYKWFSQRILFKEGFDERYPFCGRNHICITRIKPFYRSNLLLQGALQLYFARQVAKRVDWSLPDITNRGDIWDTTVELYDYPTPSELQVLREPEELTDVRGPKALQALTIALHFLDKELFRRSRNRKEYFRRMERS